MMRRLFSLGLAGCALALLPLHAAVADDLPVRKAGLWEMKILKSGSAQPEMTMQHCTDETIDKDMNNLVSPMVKQICSKQDLQKTATGYIADSVCSIAGTTMATHSEITGDFNSAYTVTSKLHSDRLDTVTTIEAKWLGACKDNQKPGDIVMPGGYKLNVKDMDKLKALLPSRKN